MEALKCFHSGAFATPPWPPPTRSLFHLSRGVTQFDTVQGLAKTRIP